MNLKKRLATCCVVLAICVTASPAVYADTTLNMQANSVAGDAADYSGYRIKWYTTNLDGSRTENTTILTDTSGACTLTIPDGAFGLGYEIYTSDGEQVSDYKQILTGSPQFWDNTEPIWFDLAPKASQLPTDLTVVDDDNSATVLDLSHFGISGSTPQGNTSADGSPSNGVQADVKTPEYAGKVRVVSDVNIDLLRNQGITFYATQGGQQSRIDLSLLPSEYSDFTLPSSGTFTFSISSSAVSAWSTVEITNTGDNMAEIKVTPKCLLYVTNGGKEVQAQVLNTGYKHPDKVILGVRNGEEYTIVDMTTNKAYRFVVPSNVTECALDFSTMGGVPVNELAQQDAALTNSGDYDNPYNVPLTDERGLSAVSSDSDMTLLVQTVTAISNYFNEFIHLGLIALGVVLCVVSAFLIATTIRNKRMPYFVADDFTVHERKPFMCGGETGFKGVIKYIKACIFFKKYPSLRGRLLGWKDGDVFADESVPVVLWDGDDTNNDEE